MARLNSTNGKSLLPSLNDAFNELTSPNSASLANVSTESFSVVVDGAATAQARSWQNDFQGMVDSIRTTVRNAMVGMGGTASNEAATVAHQLGFTGEATPAQIEAASIMAMLVSRDKNALKAYHKRALSTSVSQEEGVTVFEAPVGGAFHYMNANTSMEAFDARNIENLRGYNVLFAFGAAIQDEYGEGFFKTVTITPDTAGFEIEVRRTVVMKESIHPQTGQWEGWDYHNLIDAYNDTTILIDDSTRIYPSLEVGNAKSEELFTLAADITPRQIPANGGAVITTNPLRPNKSIPLLGVGYNSAIPGKLDQQASIDGAPEIEKIYLKVTTAGGTSVIPVSTAGFTRNNFLKSQQGKDREMSLDFPLNDIYFSGATEDISGAPAVALAFLNAAPFEDVQVRIGTLIAGNLNLQFGNILVNGSNGRVLGGRVVNGPNDYETITDETTLDDLTAEFTSIELIGYDVKAFRANLERRQLGLLIDSIAERIRYMVPLSPPISLQRPITDTPTANDLAAPLNAVRLRNSINAVTQMLETRRMLAQVVGQINYASPTDQAPEIDGFARLMVRPILVEDTVNVADIIQNTSSHTRSLDVCAVLVNRIRWHVTNAYTESRYQVALDAYNGTPGERPTVIIGTDPTTASYLQVEGDPRLFAGLGFKHKIVVTYDVRHRGKIACGFVREGQSEVDILSNGVMANIPELVTNCVLPFNGGNSEVTQVQGRTRHIPLLPIQVWIEVEGLEQSASGRTDFKVDMA